MDPVDAVVVRAATGVLTASTTSSGASQPGEASSREQARAPVSLPAAPPPARKFEASTTGTFSGSPGRWGRPARTSILESPGLDASASLILTITVGLAAIIGTIRGIVLLGYFNRRPLLLTGFIGVAAGHAVLALSFLLPESGFRSYLILAAMQIVAFFVQTLIGTLVWLLLSEIFPMTIRGFAMGIAVFVLWTVNAAISFAFPRWWRRWAQPSPSACSP